MVRKWVSTLGILSSVLDKALLKQNPEGIHFDGRVENREH